MQKKKNATFKLDVVLKTEVSKIFDFTRLPQDCFLNLTIDGSCSHTYTFARRTPKDGRLPWEVACAENDVHSLVNSH